MESIEMRSLQPKCELKALFGRWDSECQVQRFNQGGEGWESVFSRWSLGHNLPLEFFWLLYGNGWKNFWAVHLRNHLYLLLHVEFGKFILLLWASKELQVHGQAFAPVSL